MEGSYSKYWLAGIGACLCLAVAAVFMGGLNQDEGWYLYAANLVAEGKIPYRDFFFTQGPLLPFIYAPFAFVWDVFGIAGARVFTVAIGLLGVFLASYLAGRLALGETARTTRLLTFLLLGCNLYHIYYLSVPKTYALASLFVLAGFCLYVKALHSAGCSALRGLLFASSASMLAFASGCRISLCLLLAVCAAVLLLNFKTLRWSFLYFSLGGFAVLLLVYGPFVFDSRAFEGLLAAQKYHAAREGSSPMFFIGSLSRLVRWYLPLFVIFGMAIYSGGFLRTLKTAPLALRLSNAAVLLGFAAVFAVQMLAPFPYEDYQVPICPLLTIASVVAVCANSHVSRRAMPLRPLAMLSLGLSFAVSFGSPLLEKWTVDGQDRLWTLKKDKSELALLREAAKKIESLDPGGKTLLTQDLYLAIETSRKVPHGLEMGPFSTLTDEQWRRLLSTTDCKVAALSGYTFAVDPPSCVQRPLDEQFEFWNILKSRYSYAGKIDAFGQNSTALLFLTLNGQSGESSEKGGCK